MPRIQQMKVDSHIGSIDFDEELKEALADKNRNDYMDSVRNKTDELLN